MSSWNELSTSYVVPAVCTQKIRHIAKHVASFKATFVEDPKYQPDNYSKTKVAQGITTDLPSRMDSLVSSKVSAERHGYELASFLRETLQFNDIGKTVDESVKPILAYYSATMLFEFFTRSIFHFNNPSSSHGLSLKVDQGLAPENQVLSIKRGGEFQRIVDTLALLDIATDFKPMEYVKKQFELSSSKLSYFTKPKMTMGELIELRQKASDDEAHKSMTRDLLDYLLLYSGSVFARYHPYIWHEVVEGRTSAMIAPFRLAMGRAEILTKKLIFAVEALSHSNMPHYVLTNTDVHIDQAKGYNQTYFMDNPGWKR